MYRDPVRLGNQQVRPIQRGTTSALLPSASGHVHAEKLLTWEAGNTKTLSELTADTIGVGLGNHHFILEAGSAPRDGLTCGERTDGNESASCSYTGATGIDQYGSRGAVRCHTALAVSTPSLLIQQSPPLLWLGLRCEAERTYQLLNSIHDGDDVQLDQSRFTPSNDLHAW